jgi:TonB family protein
MVDVTARDPSGSLIDGLSADDFVLAEDNNAQAIKIFEFQKLDDGNHGPSSYYVLGYYTHEKADGRYGRVTAALKRDTKVKLDYRGGAYAPSGTVDDSDKNIGAHFSVGGAADADTRLAIEPAVVIQKIDPEYSEQARKARLSGTVGLLVDVNTAGQVSGLTVIHSLGMGLDEKAVEAVTQWKFKPGTTDGMPVTTQVRVDLNFRLL